MAGGKGASLAVMTQAGFPVPRGFVVPTTGGAAAGILPPTLADAVAEAYARLGSGRVAVRSSATSEDSADASFAGQHETVLNVEGIDPVLDAVARCAASLHTDRAVAYRAHRGLAEVGASMAVVVQTMAPHEASGVVFTTNPLSGRRDELLVNATAGVGESLVSGEVIPDQWVARRPDGAVLSFEPARRGPAGGMFRSRASRGVLSSDQVRSLAALALRIEKHYGGAPQDIEWSFGAGAFHVLQSRPVTAARPAGR